MQLDPQPRQFDVIATENMFGIFSARAAMLTGASHAAIGERWRRRRVARNEPSHGSALRHAVAGCPAIIPAPRILSAAMMLDLSFGESAAGGAITSAVETALEQGARTPDIAMAARRRWAAPR